MTHQVHDQDQPVSPMLFLPLHVFAKASKGHSGFDTVRDTSECDFWHALKYRTVRLMQAGRKKPPPLPGPRSLSYEPYHLPLYTDLAQETTLPWPRSLSYQLLLRDFHLPTATITTGWPAMA